MIVRSLRCNNSDCNTMFAVCATTAARMERLAHLMATTHVLTARFVRCYHPESSSRELPPLPPAFLPPLPPHKEAPTGAAGGTGAIAGGSIERTGAAAGITDKWEDPGRTTAAAEKSPTDIGAPTVERTPGRAGIIMSPPCPAHIELPPASSTDTITSDSCERTGGAAVSLPPHVACLHDHAVVPAAGSTGAVTSRSAQHTDDLAVVTVLSLPLWPYNNLLEKPSTIGTGAVTPSSVGGIGSAAVAEGSCDASSPPASAEKNAGPDSSES